MQTNNSTDNQSIMASLVRDMIAEKRSERRWRNTRFFIILLIIFIIIYLIFSETIQPPVTGEGKEYVGLIRLEGMIGPDDNFSSQNVIPLLENAMKDTEAKGLILDINSGGGTPVQASIIHDAILQLKKKYHKKVVVVGEDTLASGAYFVAVAADKIYVNPNTVTGSIGVVMKGFGFVDLIKKMGIDRRVYTAGTEKDRLDPFLPQNQADVDKIQQVIKEVHDNFIKIVLEGRKDKLKGEANTLFSGDFWSGESAVKLGLADGLGNLTDVMYQEFKVTRFKDYSQSPSVFSSLVGQMGMSMKLFFEERLQLFEKI